MGTTTSKSKKLTSSENSLPSPFPASELSPGTAAPRAKAFVDPRSPVVDYTRTPLAPRNVNNRGSTQLNNPTVARLQGFVDPRSPATSRTPVVKQHVNEIFFDPRSPSIVRTPINTAQSVVKMADSSPISRFNIPK